MPHHYDDGFKSANAANILWNITAPFTQAPTATALQVAADTLVETMVRKVKDATANQRRRNCPRSLNAFQRIAPGSRKRR